MDLLLLRLTLALYLVAALASFAAVWWRQSLWGRVVPALIGAGCASHLCALLARGVATGHCPLHTPGEVVSLLALAGMLIFLLGFYRRGLQVLSVVLLPLAMVLALVSNLLPAEAVPVAGRGADGLRMMHVAVSALAAALLFVPFAGALLYLWQERALKRKGGATVLRLRLPPLEACDALIYGSLLLCFLLLTLSIVTGAAWKAASPRHTFWLWEQRETLALLAWAIFGALLGARLLAGWRGRKAAYWVLAGVTAVLLRMVGLSL